MFSMRKKISDATQPRCRQTIGSSRVQMLGCSFLTSLIPTFHINYSQIHNADLGFHLSEYYDFYSFPSTIDITVQEELSKPEKEVPEETKFSDAKYKSFSDGDFKDYPNDPVFQLLEKIWNQKKNGDSETFASMTAEIEQLKQLLNSGSDVIENKVFTDFFFELCRRRFVTLIKAIVEAQPKFALLKHPISGCTPLHALASGAPEYAEPKYSFDEFEDLFKLLKTHAPEIENQMNSNKLKAVDQIKMSSGQPETDSNDYYILTLLKSPNEGSKQDSPSSNPIKKSENSIQTSVDGMPYSKTENVADSAIQSKELSEAPPPQQLPILDKDDKSSTTEAAPNTNQNNPSVQNTNRNQPQVHQSAENFQQQTSSNSLKRKPEVVQKTNDYPPVHQSAEKFQQETFSSSLKDSMEKNKSMLPEEQNSSYKKTKATESAVTRSNTNISSKEMKADVQKPTYNDLQNSNLNTNSLNSNLNQTENSSFSPNNNHYGNSNNVSSSFNQTPSSNSYSSTPNYPSSYNSYSSTPNYPSSNSYSSTPNYPSSYNSYSSTPYYSPSDQTLNYPYGNGAAPYNIGNNYSYRSSYPEFSNRSADCSPYSYYRSFPSQLSHRSSDPLYNDAYKNSYYRHSPSYYQRRAVSSTPFTTVLPDSKLSLSPASSYSSLQSPSSHLPLVPTALAITESKSNVDPESNKPLVSSFIGSDLSFKPLTNKSLSLPSLHLTSNDANTHFIKNQHNRGNSSQAENALKRRSCMASLNVTKEAAPADQKIAADDTATHHSTVSPLEDVTTDSSVSQHSNQQDFSTAHSANLNSAISHLNGSSEVKPVVLRNINRQNRLQNKKSRSMYFLNSSEHSTDSPFINHSADAKVKETENGSLRKFHSVSNLSNYQNSKRSSIFNFRSKPHRNKPSIEDTSVFPNSSFSKTHSNKATSRVVSHPSAGDLETPITSSSDNITSALRRRKPNTEIQTSKAETALKRKTFCALTDANKEAILTAENTHVNATAEKHKPVLSVEGNTSAVDNFVIQHSTNHDSGTSHSLNGFSIQESANVVLRNVKRSNGQRNKRPQSLNLPQKVLDNVVDSLGTEQSETKVEETGKWPLKKSDSMPNLSVDKNFKCTDQDKHRSPVKKRPVSCMYSSIGSIQNLTKEGTSAFSKTPSIKTSLTGSFSSIFSHRSAGDLHTSSASSNHTNNSILRHRFGNQDTKRRFTSGLQTSKAEVALKRKTIFVLPAANTEAKMNDQKIHVNAEKHRTISSSQGDICNTTAVDSSVSQNSYQQDSSVPQSVDRSSAIKRSNGSCEFKPVVLRNINRQQNRLQNGRIRSVYFPLNSSEHSTNSSFVKHSETKMKETENGV